MTEKKSVLYILGFINKFFMYSLLTMPKLRTDNVVAKYQQTRYVKVTFEIIRCK